MVSRMGPEKKLKVKSKTQHRDFEQHQPQAASQQVARKLGAGAPAAHPVIRAHPGREQENRRTEMRDPAGEEDRGRSPRQILGLELLRGGVEVFAGVIERHDHHDEAAQRVDGLEPLALHYRFSTSS